jgi:hypothetical protein
MAQSGQVRNNEGRERFELEVDGATAVAQYKLESGVLHMTHTVVPEEVEGRGIGSKLVRGALDNIRTRGLKVDPVCPFVRSFIERHPEYRDLVAG